MLNFAEKYGKNYVYSQFGEEGILTECVNRIGIVGGYCVEVGGNDGHYCSNTARLIDFGWQGLFVEADYDLYLKCRQNWSAKLDRGVRVQCCKVDDKNVNAFVDDSCDIFSTDTDGWDYRIFEGLKAKPKVVIIEIDSSIPPQMEVRNSDGASGYSETLKLGLAKGYFLLCHTGNLIFVDNKYRDLFPEVEGDGLSNWDQYFNNGWLMAA